MNEPTKLNTPYVHGNTSSANYNGDVIMMHYKVYLAEVDTGNNKKLLADTFSYKLGVSCSEIKWGFDNGGAYGHDINNKRISITLHDIAGKLIADIVKIQSMKYWIYFVGPTSTGELWSGPPVIYSPDPKDCKIEFSPTQGFTYTISGIPAMTLPSSQAVTNSQEFSLTGFAGDGISKGSTFADYLKKHLVARWNSYITQDLKKPQAKIKIIPDESHPLMKNRAQVTVKNEKGTQDRIEPFKVPAGKSISDVITELWETRFKKKEKDLQKNKHGSIGHRPTLQIFFEKWKGKEVVIHVKFTDNKDAKSTSNNLDICIGSDMNCVGSLYRGQLVSMDFGPLYSQMQAISNHIDNAKGSTDPHRSTGAQGGNDGGDVETGVNENEARPGHENITELPFSSGLTKKSDGSWGLIDAVIKAGNVPKFTIGVELPYSYAFTPDVHGGLLKPLIDGLITGGIATNQGANLEFFWYTDPNCSVLIKQPEISGTYRIATVTHTIGLSGNTTQVTLATLNII